MKFIANFISIVLIPLLLPMYLGCIIIYYFPALVQPANDKWLSLSAIFVSTIALPFAFFYILYKLKVISSLGLEKRKDRYLPQAFSCVCYISVTLYFIHKLGLADIFSLTMAATTLALIIITLVNLYWKISAHAAGAAGFLSVLIMVYVKHPDPAFFVPLVVISFLCVSVCFARIYLKVHTVAQVVAGGLLSTAIEVAVLHFYK